MRRKLDTNQLISPDGEVLTLRNPTPKGAELVWPDGSVFDVDADGHPLSEANKPRFLAWYTQTLKGGT